VGIVKNRCKNGDHYWVQATVTPTRIGGRIVGYTSVRSMASREQIGAADAAYRRFRRTAPAAWRSAMAPWCVLAWQA
jgi:aerotaxis receptor